MGFSSPRVFVASTVMVTGKVFVAAVSAKQAEPPKRASPANTRRSRREEALNIPTTDMSLLTSAPTLLVENIAMVSRIVLFPDALRFESPVHVALVGHGFMHQREQFRVINSQRFARADGMCCVGRRGILAAGVEVGEHTRIPIRHSIMKGGRA